MNDNQYYVRGCTALLDAIGGAIHHIGNVHKYAREEDRPEKTLFIITTDGIDSNRALNYVSDHKGTQLNYEVLNKTVSEFRACKSLVKEEIDAMFAACSAPIKDDYKKRHRN